VPFATIVATVPTESVSVKRTTGPDGRFQLAFNLGHSQVEAEMTVLKEGFEPKHVMHLRSEQPVETCLQTSR
jgi:hypothetical protein